MSHFQHALLLVCVSFFLAAAFVNDSMADHHEGEKQLIELRYYHSKSVEAAKKMEEHLVSALLPALNRAGSKSVGIFREAKEQDQPIRLVVIAHDSVSDFAGLGKKLAADATYQSTAAEYMTMSKDDNPLVRIRSELLDSFDCWPKLKVPAQTKVDGRIFELRVYESSNERMGNLKVEMFNSGEVPIFLDSGVTPVFMGKAIAGDKMPNLTYLTVYKDQAVMDQAWDNFRKHPDWQVMKKIEKFKGTVSKIHKLNLVPVPGSQL